MELRDQEDREILSHANGLDMGMIATQSATDFVALCKEKKWIMSATREQMVTWSIHPQFSIAVLMVKTTFGHC